MLAWCEFAFSSCTPTSMFLQFYPKLHCIPERIDGITVNKKLIKLNFMILLSLLIGILITV